MKKDVETRADLKLVLRTFYSRLLNESKLYPYFEKFRDDQILEEHLKDLTDFWESSLFYEGSYNKNVMEIHRRIDASNKLTADHFEAWLFHFEQAVDKFFTGENSHTLKSRARSIATVMQIKFGNSDE